MRKRRRIYIIIMTAVAAAMLLTACQPTPDEAVVVNKGSYALEDKVLESAQNAGEKVTPMDDKIVWSETKSVNFEDQGEYTVTVNMNVETPEIPKNVPVYLIEPKEFSIDFMKRAAEYLLKGEIYDGTESKDDITKELLDFKKDLSSHKILDGYQEESDALLDSYNERYNNAAQSNSVAKFKYSDEEYGERGLYLKSYLNDDSIMDFYASEGLETRLIDNFFVRVNSYNRSFQYVNHSSDQNAQANGVKTTYSQALAIADKAMSTLFTESYTLAQSDIIDIVNNNEYLWNFDDITSEGQAYVFYYTREYSGIPSLLINDAPIYLTEQTEYAAPYFREGAFIVVDDRGVVEMRYDSFSKIDETINDNTKILPFDDILERFKDGVFYHNIWGGAGSTTEINITNIVFGMVREPIKDNPNQYMMIPAWNFVGNIGTSDWDDKSGEGNDTSTLALNAIDGSIITDYKSMLIPK